MSISLNQQFLIDLETNPEDWGTRLIWADYCDDHGQGGRAEALRWMAEHEKRAHYKRAGKVDTSINATWFNADKVSPDLPDIESNIPEAIYLKLAGGKEAGNHKTFEMFVMAETAFHAAFVTARMDGWVPTKKEGG